MLLPSFGPHFVALLVALPLQGMEFSFYISTNGVVGCVRLYWSRDKFSHIHVNVSHWIIGKRRVHSRPVLSCWGSVCH